MSVKQVNLGNLQRKLCKRMRVSFAQDSLKCQNWKVKTVGIWIGQRSSCSVTKLYNYPKTNYPFKGTGSRFSTCSWIKMLFFCRDMLYRLWKQHDHVIIMSKNQSTHSPGSYLINLGAISCKLINHGIKRSGQQ